MSKKSIMRCSVLFGKSASLEKESGKVISKDQWSETHVHGGGGGGQNGYNSHVHISSTVTDKSKIWLKDPDGKEIVWTLNNTDIGGREGHVVSMAWLRRKNGKKAYGIAAYNHNLEKFEWWNGGLSAPLSPNLLFWLIFLLPTALLWVDYLSSDMATSDMVIFSIILFIGGAFSALIISGLFLYIRKLLFSLTYKKQIKTFLSEKVEFTSI